MRRCFAVLLVIVFVSVSLVSLVTVVQAQTPTVSAGKEFTLPIPNGTDKAWLAFTGVGHSLRYPLAWQAQPYQTQGGLRNSALFQFVWIDSQGLAAQIESLEIVNATDGTAALDTELAYWQQTTPRAYQVEAVTVQGHPGWWIHTAQPLDVLGLAGTLWTNWGERVYRFRLTCRPDTCMESEQPLRQMLSTLQVATVDWQRAPEPLPTSSQNTSGRAGVAPNSPTVVTYNRGAAYAYANSWWSATNNSDGCYLWYSSVLGCVKDPGDYGVDGPHFVNRAVYAGGRPIPALWDAAAVNAVGLRNWLQGDGWTTTPAAQAAVGDVAIMGPFSNPCWAGLVVVTGTNPTLATHSAELWASANSMYCYDNGSPTYVKTYLHANTEVVTSHVYLPLIAKPTPPPPMKSKAGIHLGNRSADWNANMLNAIDGSKPGGIWPAMITVLSDQVYNLGRPPISQTNNLNCNIVNVEPWKDKDTGEIYTVYNYLKRAAQAGVKVVIRVNPSPGNFRDWNDPDMGDHHLSAGDTPYGGGYCGYNGHQHDVRDVKDIAIEMQQIHAFNASQGWQEYAFEPANEVNTEWYNDDPQKISRRRVEAWQEMDAYFSTLYDQVKSLDTNIRILTPPMAQSAYAEPFEINSPITLTTCIPRAVIDVNNKEVGSGYDNMMATYTTKNDGFSWHNYWNQGREAWGNCPPTHHVYKVFPQWMKDQIRNSGKPSFITESDLSSPGQGMGNLLGSKDDPAATADSIEQFIAAEVWGQNVVIWLINNNFADKPEYDWHEAFNDNDTARGWFTEWWQRSGQ